MHEIEITKHTNDLDLSMFFYKDTLNEILSIRNYLFGKKHLDIVDKWIRLLLTNRLTGHLSGFLSVYTMPPNQAVTREQQIKINQKRNQKPDYRHTIRLTGHLSGFLSVYTMPPNQAVTQEQQIKINQKRNQKPDYRHIVAARTNERQNTALRDFKSSKKKLKKVQIFDDPS